MSDSEDDRADLPEDDAGGEDLFGDEDGDGARSDKQDLLSDEDDRSGRGDEGYDGDGVEREEHEQLVSGLTFYRHRVPKPKDGIVSCNKTRVQNWPRLELTTRRSATFPAHS